MDHNATVIKDLQEKQDAYDRDIDAAVTELNKKIGKEVVFTVPVGQAAVALRKKIAEGQAPGLRGQWDLFRDCWGHPRPALQVLSAYCHFAVIYRRSPVGLPVPAALKSGEGAAGLEKINGIIKGLGSEYRTVNPAPEEIEKLNRLLQELAWAAVTTHPLTGVTVGK